MKIAFTFASTPPRHLGGTDAETYLRDRRGSWVQDIAEGVARLGHEVSVHLIYPITGEAEHNRVPWFFSKPTLSAAFLREGKEPSIPFLRKLFGERPDIIQYQRIGYTVNFALISLLARLKGIPLVGQDHGDWSDVYRGGPVVGLPLRIGMRLADEVIFLTRESQQTHQHLFTIPRSCVIPNGYAPHFRPMDKEQARAQTGIRGDPVILWVAFFVSHKRPFTVLKAFRRVVAEHPSARLCMVGGGIGEPKMRATVEADDLLRTTVDLRPFINNPDLPPVYSSGDIYVMASEYEGMAISVLEAMACGCAVVLSDIPSFLFSTRDGKYGQHFPVGDEEALADRLLTLIRHPQLRQKIAEGGQRWVSLNLTLEHTARRLVSLYAQVIARRKATTE